MGADVMATQEPGHQSPWFDYVEPGLKLHHILFGYQQNKAIGRYPAYQFAKGVGVGTSDEIFHPYIETNDFYSLLKIYGVWVFETPINLPFVVFINSSYSHTQWHLSNIKVIQRV